MPPFCAASNHTLYIYMEDDLELTWSALKAWAHDESLLAPLGFHRGFVRVESAQWDGNLMAFDQMNRVSVSAEDSGTLSVAASNSAEFSHLSGNATAHFVHLSVSYMAMWLAMHDQVGEWLLSPEWGIAGEALRAQIREEAAWNLYTIASKEFEPRKRGFERSLVVPYNPYTSKVAHSAMLPHLSNNYCAKSAASEGVFCTIRFDDVLVE